MSASEGLPLASALLAASAAASLGFVAVGAAVVSPGLGAAAEAEASLGVVRKGIAMFEKVNVPILGIIENMSYFTAPNGERVEIFGHGGGHAEAERQNITFLGEIPIFTEIRIGGDTGVPVVVSAPNSAAGQSFMRIAQTLRGKLG